MCKTPEAELWRSQWDCTCDGGVLGLDVGGVLGVDVCVLLLGGGDLAFDLDVIATGAIQVEAQILYDLHLALEQIHLADPPAAQPHVTTTIQNLPPTCQLFQGSDCSRVGTLQIQRTSNRGPGQTA